MIDEGGHFRRHINDAQVGQPRRGLFVLNPDVKLPDEQILDEQRDSTDHRVPLGGGVGGDVCI